MWWFQEEARSCSEVSRHASSRSRGPGSCGVQSPQESKNPLGGSRFWSWSSQKLSVIGIRETRKNKKAGRKEVSLKSIGGIHCTVAFYRWEGQTHHPLRRKASSRSPRPSACARGVAGLPWQAGELTSSPCPFHAPRTGKLRTSAPEDRQGARPGMPAYHRPGRTHTKCPTFVASFRGLVAAAYCCPFTDEQRGTPERDSFRATQQAWYRHR